LDSSNIIIPIASGTKSDVFISCDFRVLAWFCDEEDEEVAVVATALTM
jgi:hypothetical protein